MCVCVCMSQVASSEQMNVHVGGCDLGHVCVNVQLCICVNVRVCVCMCESGPVSVQMWAGGCESRCTSIYMCVDVCVSCVHACVDLCETQGY